MNTDNKTVVRKLTIHDLIDHDEKNYSQSNRNYRIPKNQQEFGEKKRIKP